MRKVLNLVAIAVFILTISCKKEQDIKKDKEFASMEFNKNDHDFGTITEGDNVETVFTFKNTGKADLLISKAKGSCGCTIPEYPKKPIKPGESGNIRVSFNSARKPGMQHKSVTILANTKKGREMITIKALVNPKPDAINNNKKINNNQNKNNKHG